MKKILVLPVKNEEWILEKFLAVNSLWADHIIIADQNSTDRTLEICSKFSKVIVIKNESKFHSSSVRKLLLDRARQFEGNNAVFSFDADEIPTVHILDNVFWSQVFALKPGSAIMLQWVNLWRSPYKYREDKSVWSNSWKHFGFIDDRISDFTNVNIINDHTSRVPIDYLKNTTTIQFPKILHFQFVNWQRMLSKQCYYMLSEVIHGDGGIIDIIKINRKYFPTRDERNISLADIPKDWLETYKIDFNELKTNDTLQWYDYEIINIFKDKEIDKFVWLDIWNVDWNSKQEKFIKNNIENVKLKNLADPRNFMQKFYHSHLQNFLADSSILYKIYKKVY